MQKIIYTKRLLLRSFTLDDVDDVITLAGDKKIAKNTLNIPYPYKKEEAIDWINSHEKKYKEGILISYAITVKKTKDLIGCVSLRIDKKHDNAELGYWIGKNNWNKGFCSEAAKALINYGFSELKLNKIYATHFDINPASGRVMEKIGMKLEGHLKKHVKKWNKYYDLIWYGILKKNRQ